MSADEHEDAVDPEIPVWEDEYLDRVSDRLMFNYDLERDYRVRGETFPMYGEMRIESQKHFLHRSINYANHESHEHLLVTRRPHVGVADLERLVELGHDLADEWIDTSDEHFSTDVTFVVVAETVPDDVEAFVADFRDRNLLRFGFHGHYEVNLVVAAPDEESLVASRSADVGQAFAIWAPIETGSPGLLARIVRRIRS
jgi:hypothetical protein